MKYLHFLIILYFLQPSKVEAQIVYASTFTPQTGQILKVNLGTCTTTPLVDIPAGTLDMCIAPNGLVYIVRAAIQIESVDTLSGTITPVATLPNIAASGLEWGEDGFLYAISAFIFKINPTTGLVQNMGQFPAGWVSTGELVYLNGIYYGAMNTPQGWKLVNVNLNNPAASTIITNMVLPFAGGASINHPTCPKLIWFVYDTTPPSEVWEYDVNTQTWAVACNNIPFIIGGGDSPNDYSFPISCPCTTNAGNVMPQSFNLCGTSSTVTVPFTGGQILDADDILQYILFENLSDPVGSILSQSASAVIGFDANTMVIGQTYYLGSIAGNNLNGLVALDDPCLDLSDNFAQVTWLDLPTVSFSTAQNDICAGDCQDVAVTFTGSTPFNLTYNSPLGQQTQIFGTNSGVLSICPPAGFLGPLTVEAISLTDANCTCE